MHSEKKEDFRIFSCPRPPRRINLTAMTNDNIKSLESWIWDAACSIRGAKDAPKFKDYILPLIFTKRLCDVFDDELNRIADIFKTWREKEKYSRIVTHEEIAKNDFNISPSRYIHTGAADEYRPIAEIVEELDALEIETRATDNALKAILGRLTA